MKVSYTNSWLWTRAFVEKRTDVDPHEQEFFLHQYESIHSKSSNLVEGISKDIPSLTVHDITHLDALWEMGSIVAVGAVELNPPEAFVFGASVLIHDAAMTVSAYSKGLEGLKQETAWKDTFARLCMEASDREEEHSDSDIEKRATEETLRILHASQAEKLATQVWKSSDAEDEYLINDPEIREFYGPTIGKVAHSHWWSVAKVADEFSNGLGPLGGKTRNSIDLLKIACLLRISDAMHIDSRRAPSFRRVLIKPTGLADQHWRFQKKIAVPIEENSTLRYSASSPFTREEAGAWWLAFDTISMIDKELREVDHLLQQTNRSKLKANRVIGANSSRELSQYIRTDGWEPVDCAIRVSDVPKIVGALGGDKLYGNDPTCAIRELIQNGADAVKTRRSLEERGIDWGVVSIGIERRDRCDWLVVEDTGIGMSSSVLTGPLVDFGNSFWRSPLAALEFPGIHDAGISTIGRYGIGFFAVFMLGEKVLVTSRRYDKSTDSSLTLEFQNGLASRPILYATPTGMIPLDGRTRVEVCLDHRPREKGGILAWNRFGLETEGLQALVGSLAPNLDVTLLVGEDGNDKEPVVIAYDWLKLEEPKLLSRLSSTTPSNDGLENNSASRLRCLVGRDGHVFGRAAIRPPSWKDENEGCVSVGGLRASSVSWITGLFQGRETTASRNSAVVDVPAEVLSSWATEQASLLEKANVDDETKAHGASIVLLCGGSIRELAFARFKGSWRSCEAIAKSLVELNEITVIFENDIQYDEDIDDTHPREFSQSFEESKSIVFVPDDFPEPGVRRDVKELFVAHQAGNSNAYLSSVFCRVLSSVWEEFEEEEDQWVTVGSTEIERPATRYVRV